MNSTDANADLLGNLLIKINQILSLAREGKIGTDLLYAMLSTDLISEILCWWE